MNQFRTLTHCFLKLHFNIILPSMPRSRKLPCCSGLFSTKRLYMFLISPRHSTRSTSSSFKHLPVTSSLLGPKFSSALCSQSSSVYVLDVRRETDQVSHPYKVTSTIIVLCTINFTFLHKRQHTQNESH